MHFRFHWQVWGNLHFARIQEMDEEVFNLLEKAGFRRKQKGQIDLGQ
jgi:hypothetical protein